MSNKHLSWREAFIFNRSEKRGFLLLTLLLLLTVAVRVVYFQYIKPPHIAFSIPEKWTIGEAISNQTTSEALDTSFHHPYRKNDLYQRSVHNRWPFDSVPMKAYSSPFKRSRIIELNTADTLELRGLPSIGPWLSRKIVEYRDRLGGFYSSEQLLEVYRLTPGKLDTIAPFLVIDTSWVRRININTVTLDELLQHPYLSRSQAKGLLAYRGKHGAFDSVADLRKCLLIDENTFEKMRDYVKVR
jgi:DNA uptake protein ComE-like DNA-binding protein